jgi:hypothetical protein
MFAFQDYQFINSLLADNDAKAFEFNLKNIFYL